MPVSELKMFDPAGEFNKGYANGLAGLAFRSQGADRESALGKLAGIDAGAAYKLKAAAEEQDYSGLVKAASVLKAFKGTPQAEQAYASLAPRMAQQYGIQLPPHLDDSVWQAVDQITGAAQGDTRWIQTVDENNQPVWAAATNQGITPTQHRIPDSYKFDTDEATGLQYRYGGKTGTREAVGSQPSGMTEGDLTSYLDALNEKVRELKASGVPDEQINAFSENAVNSLPKAFTASPRRSDGYVGMSAAGRARAEAQAKADVALGMDPEIERRKAEAKYSAEAQNAPAIAGATAYASEQGKSSAEVQANAVKAIPKAKSLLAVIDKAIKHPGRAWATGGTAVLPWDYAPGSPGKDYMAIQKQLEGKAFLEAFESLKGGGQITVIEGEKATQAMARLDRAQSEDAYLEALNDLKQIVKDSISRAEMQARGRQGQQPATVDDDALINKYLRK